MGNVATLLCCMAGFDAMALVPDDRLVRDALLRLNPALPFDWAVSCATAILALNEAGRVEDAWEVVSYARGMPAPTRH